jgi:hypothetical protein
MAPRCAPMASARTSSRPIGNVEMAPRCTPTALVRTSSPCLTGDEDGATLHTGSPIKVVVVQLVGAVEMAPRCPPAAPARMLSLRRGGWRQAVRRQPHQGWCRPRHGGWRRAVRRQPNVVVLAMADGAGLFAGSLIKVGVVLAMADGAGLFAGSPTSSSVAWCRVGDGARMCTPPALTSSSSPWRMAPGCTPAAPTWPSSAVSSDVTVQPYACAWRERDRGRRNIQP